MKKNLDWKQLQFSLASQQVDGQWSFTLQPKGLAASNELIKQDIAGPVVSAQIGDLDQDGWPEILVSWESSPDHQGATVYSVNRGKSLSQVGFPSGEDRGPGKFWMQNQVVVRRDLDTIETHYHLKAGEALKQLVADREHPSPLDFGLPRGFSTKKMDLKADPRKDFQSYTSGTWYKRAKLPADSLKFSGPALVLKVVNSQIRTVLEDAQQRSPKAKKGSPLQQVGDFYASGMDTARLDQLGISPIKADLEKLSSIDSYSKLSQALTEWSGRLNDVIGCNVLVSTDQQDRSKISVYVGESGLDGFS